MYAKANMTTNVVPKKGTALDFLTALMMKFHIDIYTNQIYQL